MRKSYVFRSFLAISTLTFGLLSTGGGGAFAQKASIMTPQTAWAVNKVANEDDISQSYCAIAKRYDLATIFTLARNVQGEASIAIDFQSAKFNINDGLRVVLDPGASQERVFQVFPVNEKAIVVRLGQDDAFFKALQRTGFLRVEAGEQSYHFNIADIDQGEGSLSECITSLTSPPPPPQKYTGSDAAFAPNEAASLKTEIQSLKEETRRLSSLLSNLSGVSTGVSAALVGVDNFDNTAVHGDDTRMKALKSDNERLRAAIVTLENALSEKNLQIEQLQVSANESKSIKHEIETSQSDWVETMSAARRRILELEQELKAQKENAAIEFVKYQQSLERLNGEIAALQEQITVKNVELSKLSDVSKAGELVGAESVDLKEENTALKAKLVEFGRSSDARAEMLQSELTLALKKIAVLEDKLEKAEAMNADFSRLESRQSLFDDQNKPQKSDDTAGIQKISVQEPVPAKKPRDTTRDTKGVSSKNNVAKASETDLKAEDFLYAPLETSKLPSKPVRTKEIPKLSVNDPFLTPAQEQEQALRRSLEEKNTPDRIKQKIKEKEKAEKLALERQRKKIAAKAKSHMAEEERESISALEVENIKWNQPSRMAAPVVKKLLLDEKSEPKKEEQPEVIDLLDRKIAALSERQDESVNITKFEPSSGGVAPPVESKSPEQEPEPVKAIYQPAYKIQEIVSAADIAEENHIRYVEEFSNIQSASYSWQVSNVFGTAELSPILTEDDFDISVKNYLEKTEKRCKGDFAIIPEDSQQIGSMRVDSYDIACVGGGIDSSASLIFFNKSGTFTALAHEAPLDDMDAAITLRDRIEHVLAQRPS